MSDLNDTQSEQTAVLRLGTRASPLAMAQAKEVRTRLCAASGWSEDVVELVPVETSGDRIQDRALAELGGKALWTKELDAWLHDGRIDAAVHSMKDVETIRPEWIALRAVLPRADIRDSLIGADNLDALPKGAVIGTSAPRRAAQLLNHRPDCKIKLLRGNVATRLAKLEAGEADATFLAAAGLERLGQALIGNPLDARMWLPAPAQGAIGVECRADDTKTAGFLAAIDEATSHATVLAERALLAALHGTCQSPIGVMSQYSGSEITITASLFSADGAERVDGMASFAPNDLEVAQMLAKNLLERAAPNIVELFDPK